MTAQAAPLPHAGSGWPDRVAPLVFRVARLQRNLLDRRLAPYAVTSQQGGLLMRCRLGMVTPRTLSDVLGTDTAGLTRLVDRLEAKGLIAREPHPEDRRALRLRLTEAGERLSRQLVPVFAAVNAEVLRGFSDAEAEQLKQLLRRVHDNLLAAEESA